MSSYMILDRTMIEVFCRLCHVRVIRYARAIHVHLDKVSLELHMSVLTLEHVIDTCKHVCKAQVTVAIPTHHGGDLHGQMEFQGATRG